MRDASKIIELAKQTLSLLSTQGDEATVSAARQKATDNQIEIIAIGSRMDARTGTIDPSRRRRAKPKAGGGE
jgi:hypothetical protein